MSQINCSQCDETFYVTKRNLVLPFVCAECQDNPFKQSLMEKALAAPLPGPVFASYSDFLNLNLSDLSQETSQETGTLSLAEVLKHIREMLGDDRVVLALAGEGLQVDWEQIDKDIAAAEALDAADTKATSDMIADLQQQLEEVKDDRQGLAAYASRVLDESKTAQGNATAALDQRDAAYREIDELHRDYVERFFQIKDQEKQIAVLKHRERLDAFEYVSEINRLRRELTRQRLIAKESLDLAQSDIEYYRERHEHWKGYYIKLSNDFFAYKIKAERPWSVKLWDYLTTYISRWRTR